MSYSLLQAQRFGCYDQLKVVDDKNDSGSRELRPLDSMTSSGLWMTWMILGHETMALKAMNCLGLWMTSMTLGHELKALDAMNKSGLWLTWTTLGRELKVLDVLNNLGLWMTWTSLSCQLKALDALTRSRLWIIRMTWDLVSSGLYMLWTTQGWGWYQRFLVMSLCI